MRIYMEDTVIYTFVVRLPASRANVLSSVNSLDGAPLVQAKVIYIYSKVMGKMSSHKFEEINMQNVHIGVW